VLAVALGAVLWGSRSMGGQTVVVAGDDGSWPGGICGIQVRVVFVGTVRTYVGRYMRCCWRAEKET
jgi:hypothetical protein